MYNDKKHRFFKLSNLILGFEPRTLSLESQSATDYTAVGLLQHLYWPLPEGTYGTWL